MEVDGGAEEIATRKVTEASNKPDEEALETKEKAVMENQIPVPVNLPPISHAVGFDFVVLAVRRFCKRRALPSSG